MAEKQKVTLSIDSEVYNQFRKYCEENAIMLSKKVELWMSAELKAQGRLEQGSRAKKELKEHEK